MDLDEPAALHVDMYEVDWICVLSAFAVVTCTAGEREILLVDSLRRLIVEWAIRARVHAAYARAVYDLTFVHTISLAISAQPFCTAVPTLTMG